MHINNIQVSGVAIGKAEKVLVSIHGRGGTAEDILSLAAHLKVKDFALFAPQATNNTWYPHSFLMPPAQNEPGLSSALQLLKEVEEDLNSKGFTSDKIYFLGFSQGACLTLEYVCRNAKKYGGVVAFTGGLIGDMIYEENYKGKFGMTPVFLGTSDPDPHVPVERVKQTAVILQKMGAKTLLKVFKNKGHIISQEEIELANELVFG